MLAVAAFAVSGCRHEQATRYVVHGVVQEVRADRGEVIIANEAIPGYMEKMTMPFKVKDPAMLSGLVPKQAVNFFLVVSNAGIYIERIESVQNAGQAR